MKHRLLWLLLLIPFMIVVYMTMRIPGGFDAQLANDVAKYISHEYGKFDNRSKVERSGKGQIYYIRPEADFGSVITLYEVTQQEDISRIESIARRALIAFPKARKITLIFYKEQNLQFSANGGATRGSEQEFKKSTIQR